MTTRKKHTKEFKEDAVSLVIEQGYSRKEAAGSLSCSSGNAGMGQIHHS
ncbi:MAG: Unknown protein [uncultured Thiotrichaceae bacterium]|uniref:Transposase n=1 Tax=uncultured Thiotrichaceae bacterium TaxID=298394 RepID=A0A6S6U1X5_9GAMM|nr:MAG: Unknown protein [uncultured Thiotrichaceae bacterium]